MTEETYYTVSEIAVLWKLSPTTVRALFRDQPGVLKLGSPRLIRKKRQHVTLRIPASVLERVCEELSR